MCVVRMEQLGISLERRFTFYDQTHTTGMDIPQHYTARAILTLSKDMTFRDFAQGAYRMRGIGNGQTLTIMIIPEVAALIVNNAAVARSAQKRPILSGNSFEDLRDVVSWLIVNGMRSEMVCFDCVCVRLCMFVECIHVIM